MNKVYILYICKTQQQFIHSSKDNEASLRLLTPRIFAPSSHRFRRFGYSLSDSLWLTLELMTITETFGSVRGTALVTIDLLGKKWINYFLFSKCKTWVASCQK